MTEVVTKKDSHGRRRAFFLIPCGISLIVGLDAALVLLGLPAPLSGERFSSAHGMLMVIGFVGALVSLERAVAIRHRWAYIAPLGMSIGSLLTVTPAPLLCGKAVMVVGCVAAVINYISLWSRNREPLVAMQIGGGIAALGAAMSWMGNVPIPNLMAWLFTFLVVIVLAERADISRIGQLVLSPVARQRHEDSVLVLAALALLVSPLTTTWPALFFPIYGVILILLGVQSVRGDVSRKGIHQKESKTKFTAGMVLVSYFWLVIGGLLLLRPQLAGLHYDATLHAIFLGFIMSMIIAHAPTYLPILIGIKMRFVAGFWGVGVLLHVSLLARIISDLVNSENGRTVAGLGNMVALLGLVAVGVWASTTDDLAMKQSSITAVGSGSKDPSGKVKQTKIEVAESKAIDQDLATALGELA